MCDCVSERTCSIQLFTFLCLFRCFQLFLPKAKYIYTLHQAFSVFSLYPVQFSSRDVQALPTKLLHCLSNLIALYGLQFGVSGVDF